MDESEPEGEPVRSRVVPPPADDDNKYPVDGMYMSQAEKHEIMSMREVEREQLIADRISEIERQRQNRLLRQMVTNVENEERKQVKKKRSADTAELDDGHRKASKSRTGKASETAMDSLRRARAEKQRRKEDHERRKDAYSPLGADYRDRDESDDDYGRPRSRTPEAEPERELPPAELRDFERVRLGRNEFAQVCFTPGFEQAITGCYIRIALGSHPETGVEQYRMALIKGRLSCMLLKTRESSPPGSQVSRQVALMRLMVPVGRLSQTCMYGQPTEKPQRSSRSLRHPAASSAR